MRKVRIAQIGVNENSHSFQVFKSLKRQDDIFEIVGFALPENERTRLPGVVKNLAGYPEMTLEELLGDPTIEAVTVETDEVYLTKYARLAADHGKHIHMEKPGSPSLPDFEKLIETVKEKNLIFHTGYMYRYNPFVVELMNKIEAGELGDIISVEAQMNCLHPPKVRRWLKNFPGGMMFFLGCHLIDLIYRIQGEPKKIIPLNKCSHMDGVTAKDFGMAVFEYENGVSFAKTSAVETGGFLRRQLVVSGTKGTVELKPFEVCVDGLQYTDRTECFDPGWHTPGETSRSPMHDRYDTMMASYAAMVRGDKKNPFTPDYELAMFKALLRACGEEL